MKKSTNIAIQENEKPFDVKLNTLNETTLKAIEEGEFLVQDSFAKNYNNISDLKKTLGV